MAAIFDLAGVPKLPDLQGVPCARGEMNGATEDTSDGKEWSELDIADLRRSLKCGASIKDALSITADSRADMYYGPIDVGVTSQNERTAIISEREDHNLGQELFPSLSIIGIPPTYRAIVERAQMDCPELKVTIPSPHSPAAAG